MIAFENHDFFLVHINIFIYAFLSYAFEIQFWLNFELSIPYNEIWVLKRLFYT